jgi:hypothetical protein
VKGWLYIDWSAEVTKSNKIWWVSVPSLQYTTVFLKNKVKHMCKLQNTFASSACATHIISYVVGDSEGLLCIQRWLAVRAAGEVPVREGLGVPGEICTGIRVELEFEAFLHCWQGMRLVKLQFPDSSEYSSTTTGTLLKAFLSLK